MTKELLPIKLIKVKQVKLKEVYDYVEKCRNCRNVV